jgi:DNA polymerase
MSTNTPWNAMLNDLRTLLESESRGAKRLVSVPPEVAAALEALAGAPATRHLPPAAQSGAPAAVPAGPPAATSVPPTPAAPAGVLGPVSGDLAALAAEVAVCRKCPLGETRTQTVFGVGSAEASVVFVGEAPGFHEDQQGIPFVGRAGQLLTDIIEKGMKLRRDDVYICNVLKCRPPDNRDPNPVEVAACEPYLLQQLGIMQPKVIVALGKYAAQTLLKNTLSVNRLRGQWWEYHGVPLRVTFHPAYLLRNEAEKRACWADIQEVMKLLRGEETP